MAKKTIILVRHGQCHKIEEKELEQLTPLGAQTSLICVQASSRIQNRPQHSQPDDLAKARPFTSL